MSNRTREIKDEIESPDDGHEIIMEKVHYKPRLGSMDDEDETFGKQSRTYFNAKQNNQNQFNLYGIDEIEDKKLKKPGDDLIENFRPNSGGRKKDIFDDPPKKYEPSQFDTTKSSSGQKAKSGWDDDLEQDSPDPWDKKQVKLNNFLLN